MVEELRISVETLTSMVPARCHRDNDVRINSLQFSPDGFSLLVGSDDDTIRIYDASVVGLNLSPVDDMFLSWGLDRTLFLWDLRIPDPVVCFFNFFLKQLY
ncbi:WD domain, G-beta repeat protein [Trichinella nativa]|uniref:WD domain, G-beta repeat protein n=1 Tax=Trichinella nativa TaxID=6335 RepID=A0A1Y3ER34_9BILA|nr:WD domain, G-beta repeat protein [Trichinella nativa]